MPFAIGTTFKAHKHDQEENPAYKKKHIPLPTIRCHVYLATIDEAPPGEAGTLRAIACDGIFTDGGAVSRGIDVHEHLLQPFHSAFARARSGIHLLAKPSSEYILRCCRD